MNIRIYIYYTVVTLILSNVVLVRCEDATWFAVAETLVYNFVLEVVALLHDSFSKNWC